MKKVLIVCPYPHGRAPSQRFRFEQYLDLDEVEFTQVSFWKNDEWPAIYEDGSITYKVLRTIGGFTRRLGLLFQVRKYDKIFIHREATPIGPPWFEWAVVKLFKKPLIFDFDDAIWLPNSSKANEKLAGKLKFHGKTAKICSWATTCSVGNAFLADYAKQFCNDVRIIPTTIDTENHHNPNLYVPKGTKWVKKAVVVAVDQKSVEGLSASGFQLSADRLEKDKRITKNMGGQSEDKQQSAELSKSEELPEADSRQPTANTNHVTIGWTGTHSTLKQLTPLFTLLEEIHKKHPFRFLLIADIPPQSVPVFVEFRKWKKETEIEDLLEMDIGVMPLYDTDWERGKCGFKALQYMALGKIAVVSKVGVNIEIVDPEEDGFFCETMSEEEFAEWKDVFLHLLSSQENLENTGLKARVKIQRKYSVYSQIKSYYSLFSGS